TLNAVRPRYFFFGSCCQDQVVSQVLAVVIVQKGGNKRHQWSAGIVAAEAIQFAIDNLRLEWITGVPAVGSDSIVMGVEQDRGLVRIEMPVLHANVVHPAVCVDMTAFKKILNHGGHRLFLLAKRRSGDHFLKQVKRVFEKLLHTHSISTCPGSFLCLSCDQRSCRIIARVSQQIGRVPDEHFLNTLTNGRKGVLQLGKNTVGEGMFRKQFLVSLFRKACDDAVVVVDVKQYTLFLETVD